MNLLFGKKNQINPDNGIVKDNNVNKIEEERLENNEQLQKETILIIMQYLDDIGFHQTKTVLADEAHMEIRDKVIQNNEVEKLKNSIMEGEWNEVEKIFNKLNIKNINVHRNLTWNIFKLQFLELIEQHELQKAFNLLNKRLKPIEKLVNINPNEFKEMCYLLTCNSIQETNYFKGWLGITKEREKLSLNINKLIQLENNIKENQVVQPTLLPHRLLTLLNYSMKYQMLKFPKENIQPNSLLEDFKPSSLPTKKKHTLKGHNKNIKTVCNVNSTIVATAGSDTFINLFDLKNTNDTLYPIKTFHGHTARIWSLSTNNNSTLIASGSADQTVKVWNIDNDTLSLNIDLNYKDVYNVQFHPIDNNLLANAGYDKKIRILDISKNATLVNQFIGHNLPISSIAFNPNGDLLVSGSKDSLVKMYDLNSGINIKTITSHLAEITSVQIDSTGLKLLTSSKDNKNRLFDMRMLNKPITKFVGHQNSSKHFIKSLFLNEQYIASGSQDNQLFIWNWDGQLITTLNEGLVNTVYTAAYNLEADALVVGSDSNNLAVFKK